MSLHSLSNTSATFKITSHTIKDHMDDNDNIHENDDSDGGTSTAVYYTVASILSSAMVLGVVFNGIVIFIFLKNKELRTPTNSFVIALCVCDFFMSVIGMHIPIFKAWQQSKITDHALCVFDGFVVYFLGLSSMYLLAAISVDRFVVIVRPVTSLVVTHRMALLSIGACFGAGLFWAAMPLLGWNRFVPEGIGVACSISWRSLDPVSTSYIFTIFVFCLLLPVFVMAVCYIKIYLVIRKVARHSPWGDNSHVGQTNCRLERKILRTIVLMIGAFLLSWTPYAVVSLGQTFSGQALMDPVTETVPALVAKMSALWDPIIYIATNKQFRKAFYTAAPCCKSCLCVSSEQSETLETMQDESGAVLDDPRNKTQWRQKKEPPRSSFSGTSESSKVTSKPETQTMVLLGQNGKVNCELADKVVEMVPLKT